MRKGNIFSLSTLAGEGGTPSKVCGWGGVPHPRSGWGGTLSQVWVGGTPPRSEWWGIPCPRSGWWGYLIPGLGGTLDTPSPNQVWMVGGTWPVLGGGRYPNPVWMVGVPRVPPTRFGWWGYPGYPPTIQTWNGVLPTQTWDGVPPPTRSGWWGVPGYPPPGLDGVPPHPLDRAA